jgi:LuxR family maltose regulon positive regulatory protein
MQAMLAGKHAFSTAVQARLLQTQVYMGRLAAARAALAGIGDEERDTGDMRLATAVVHLAEGRADQVTHILAPVMDGSAPVLHRPAAATEAHLLGALASVQLDDRRAAEASLELALDAAEPEGIVLPFVLVPVRDLLERLPRHHTAHPTLRRTILDVLDGGAPRPAGAPAGPIDELSEAELRVARYLPSNLRAPEIAAELFVSTNTVRTHLRHIYGKLCVHGRAEAVERARQLGLLAPSHRRR